MSNEAQNKDLLGNTRELRTDFVLDTNRGIVLSLS